MRGGFLEERPGLDEGGPHFHKTRLGGLNQARYQRHIEKHRADFAREAAAEIELLVEREGASRVVLAGNQVALPLLLEALSPAVLALVRGQARGLDLLATRDVVLDEVAPILAYAEAENGLAIADQLVDAVRSDALGIAGLERTRAALEHGQVDVLVLAGEAAPDPDTRNELIRLAVTTGADVVVIEAHPVVDRLGGVGALLRYRHEAPGDVGHVTEDVAALAQGG
jgi:stalled ribosome rescue protein Dom34